MDYTVHGILQARILEIPSPADLPGPRIKLGSPALQANSLPVELPLRRKLKNSLTGVIVTERLNVVFYLIICYIVNPSTYS